MYQETILDRGKKGFWIATSTLVNLSRYNLDYRHTSSQVQALSFPLISLRKELAINSLKPWSTPNLRHLDGDLLPVFPGSETMSPSASNNWHPTWPSPGMVPPGQAGFLHGAHP